MNNKLQIVLTVSVNFMVDHPKRGQPTNFKEAILSGEKKHTIRAGEYWREVAEKVMAGTHYISVRQWTGKPYNSEQVEIHQLHKLGWQPIETKKGSMALFIDGKENKNPLFLQCVANNDGLTANDFMDWFKLGKKDFKGGILHFTDFKY